jgi:sulfite exporter TauE/SafE/copper chaperone CopZ
MQDGARVSKFAIGGMHCVNCAALVEARLKQMAGITDVRVAYPGGIAEITHNEDLDLAALQNAIADDGYTINEPGTPSASRHTTRDYAEIAGVFALVLGLALALRAFEVLPEGISISDNMSYGFAFVIGLVASVSSCIAVTGGLLVAAAAKFNAAYAHLPARQRWLPHVYFNAGRLVAYAVLGGAVGALGSALMLSQRATGIVTLVASALMIVIGLQMLRLLPGLGQFSFSRSLSERIPNLTTGGAARTAFVMGGLTFFLPCGFTQALQLYVLAKGDTVSGSLIMLAFALGTLPALLSLSAMSSFATGAAQRIFIRVAGAAVIVLGTLNIQSGLVLVGPSMVPTQPQADATATSATTKSVPAGDVQTINMTVLGLNYLPHHFTVIQGKPVQWRVDGRLAGGCGRMLVAPDLGIQEILSSNSTTVISFVPTQPGKYDFNCGMGMMTPDSTITVLPKDKG